MSTIKQHQELKENTLIVDPRNFWTRIWDSLQHPNVPLAWAGIATLITLLWPGFFMMAAIIFAVLWFAVVSKPDVLPIHLPIDADKIDKNDPKPGGVGFYKSRGSFYIGRIRGHGPEFGAEVWASFKALTQHFLIFGTTGAGKTESIVSYIVNYLSVGSAVAFQDAKAAPKAMFQIATFMRIFGRDDDFRVTNYITGLSSTSRDPAERMSNDAAVFARGNAESNTQLLVSLMPPSNGDNKIFQERAIALIAAVMPALNDLRDKGKLQIDPGTIRKYMSFKQFVGLFKNGSIRKSSRDALQGYLESLPGFDENKSAAEQNEEVSRQFGFAQAYFTRSLASLSDTYGHIYMVGQGEIDYQDAVLNGRCLLTLLPSLEKSGEELANLGKIVLTATRNGMVVGLGTVFEGSAEDVVHNLPTNSNIPYGIINDENAYMLVEGQEMLNAQARGLGFGIMTGTQDAPGMLENISRTTKQIMANSAFKQIQYLDDKETTDLAVEFSGEANVLVRGGYEREGDLGNYYASKNISSERRHRLTSTAIKRLETGQAFIMYQGKIHEVQIYNHGIGEKDKDPNLCYLKHWYPIRMAKVKVPLEHEIEALLEINPRNDWQQLVMLLRDDSRAILKEMSIYFSSIITVNRMAKALANESANDHTLREVYGLSEVLEPTDSSAAFKESTGFIGILERNPPKRFTDTTAVFAAVIKEGKDDLIVAQREADAANLDSVLSVFASDEDDSGSSGGGFGSKAQPDASEDFNLENVLSAYLDGSLDNNPSSPNANERTQEAAQAAAGTTQQRSMPPSKIDQQKRSALAQSIEKNLTLLPWMASAEEYVELHDNMTQIEMFVTGADEREASGRIDKAFDSLANHFDYPQTQLPESLAQSVDQLKKMVSNMIKE